ncbi:MAG: ferrous iron transport protein B, partial [Acidobacteriota bacterium]|nr:ferrous iron transport protein B [Acidobacteriota bacterium]
PPLVTLCGNPNTGKTSIFNRLTGKNQKVGNYPGITVEKFVAPVSLDATHPAVICDVPGTHSLSARSAEEQIAILAIAGIPPLEPPDLTVIVVDATQLSRNLYLVLQIIETGGPAIVALNMVDLLKGEGLQIDVARMEQELGIPVVSVSGLSGAGIDTLRKRMIEVLDQPETGRATCRWAPTDHRVREDIDRVARVLPDAWLRKSPARRESLAIWALLSIADDDELGYVSSELRDEVNARYAEAEKQGREIDRTIIANRFDWIDRHLKSFLQQAETARKTFTERIDSVMLHPWIGFALFLVVMGVTFQALFSWSVPAIEFVESGIGLLVKGTRAVMPDGLFTEFLVGGVIAGVGSVVVFLPQILLLFFFIGLMEDTGYMARVAFLMDRLMRAMGLNGRAFVPMLSGFACAVPAVLATRTMERQRDRFLTILVVPLMTCSARLPVYTLIIGALFPPSRVLGIFPKQGLLMLAMYVFSTGMALVVAAVLGRTLLPGGNVPLILEMPSYRRPHVRDVLRMMWLRSSVFLREAGGMILLCTIVLWVLLSFPTHPKLDTDYDALRSEAHQTMGGTALADRLDQLNDQEEGAIFRRSYGARLGQTIEPVLAPLGFDWKIGVGIIGAFAAREVFISTMGVVYGVGSESDEGSVTLRAKIHDETRDDGRPVYTPLVGLSLMVFFALACQCMSTLAVVRRETKSWRLPVFLFAYMTALAWVMSFIVYQGGRLLGFS